MSENQSTSPFRRFVYTYRKVLALAFRVNPSLLTLVTLINSFWGLTNLPVLYINKLLIDIVISSVNNPNWSRSARLIVMLISIRSLLELIRTSLSRINNTLTNHLTSRINAHVEIVLGEKLSTLDVPTLESPEFQDKYKKIDRESNQRIWAMITPLSDIPNAVFTIISGIIPIFLFKPYIALLVLLVRIPEIIVNASLSKKDYNFNEKQNPKYRLWGWISYHLSSSKHYYENHILGNTRYLARKLAGVQDEILTADYRRRITRANYRNIADIPNIILGLILNAYFFIQAIIGKITLGTAQLLYQSANTLGSGFSMFLNNAVSIYENYLFVSDFVWFIDLKPKFSSGTISKITKFSSGIELRDVWFKYPSSPDWILKGISLTINPKENIALVGENGAGKTTLIKLLCRFYVPDKGEIFINGRNLLDYDPETYWKAIGVLFQDFSEYPFTARESIGYGDVSRIKNQSEIEVAARETDTHDFISKLPLGYDNPLTKEFDKGIEPSKGQWQRIALARTIFRKSRIIILDEPTSNVDPKAEEEIFEKIINLTRDQILILISHRFSTVRRADKILLLEDGRITEQGTHEELIKLKGEYAHLFNLQAKSYQ